MDELRQLLLSLERAIGRGELSETDASLIVRRETGGQIQDINGLRTALAADARFSEFLADRRRERSLPAKIGRGARAVADALPRFPGLLSPTERRKVGALGLSLLRGNRDVVGRFVSGALNLAGADRAAARVKAETFGDPTRTSLEIAQPITAAVGQIAAEMATMIAPYVGVGRAAEVTARLIGLGRSKALLAGGAATAPLSAVLAQDPDFSFFPDMSDRERAAVEGLIDVAAGAIGVPLVGGGGRRANQLRKQVETAIEESRRIREARVAAGGRLPGAKRAVQEVSPATVGFATEGALADQLSPQAARAKVIRDVAEGLTPDAVRAHLEGQGLEAVTDARNAMFIMPDGTLLGMSGGFISPNMMHQSFLSTLRGVPPNDVGNHGLQAAQEVGVLRIRVSGNANEVAIDGFRHPTDAQVRTINKIASDRPDDAIVLANTSPGNQPKIGASTEILDVGRTRGAGRKFRSLFPKERMAPAVEADLRVSTADLSGFREIQTQPTDALRDDIRANGIRNPIELTIDPKTGRGLVTDGAHRLAAAEQLGLEEVPVRVVRAEEGLSNLLTTSPAPPTVRTFLGLPDFAIADDAATNIAVAHAEFGGSTFDPRTGESLAGRDLWTVSRRNTEVLQDTPFTDADVAEFLARDDIQAALRDDPSLSVGTWFDEGGEAHGRHEINLTKTFKGDQQDAAVQFAVQENQAAILNLAHPEFATVSVPSKQNLARGLEEGDISVAQAMYRAELDELVPERAAAREARFLEALTDTERVRFARWKENRPELAERALRNFSLTPDPREGASLALLGAASIDWYRNSAVTIRRMFGDADAPRFAALLAATSPRTSVEDNLQGALSIWRKWIDAGRPTDPEQIRRIMSGESRLAIKAAFNNTVTALTTDAADLLDVRKLIDGGLLSGPKVDPFYANLLDQVSTQVTARVANRPVIDSHMLSGFGVAPGDLTENRRLAIAANMRETAETLEQLTGRPFTVAEVQAMQWAPIKLIREKAAGLKDSRAVVDEMLLGDLFSDQPLNSLVESLEKTPSFASLIHQPRYDEVMSGLRDLGVKRPPPLPTDPAETVVFDPDLIRPADILGFATRIDRADRGKFLFGLAATAAALGGQDPEIEGPATAVAPALFARTSPFRLAGVRASWTRIAAQAARLAGLEERTVSRLITGPGPAGPVLRFLSENPSPSGDELFKVMRSALPNRIPQKDAIELQANATILADDLSKIQPGQLNPPRAESFFQDVEGQLRDFYGQTPADLQKPLYHGSQILGTFDTFDPRKGEGFGIHLGSEDQAIQRVRRGPGGSFKPPTTMKPAEGGREVRDPRVGEFIMRRENPIPVVGSDPGSFTERAILEPLQEAVGPTEDVMEVFRSKLPAELPEEASDAAVGEAVKETVEEFGFDSFDYLNIVETPPEIVQRMAGRSFSPDIEDRIDLAAEFPEAVSTIIFDPANIKSTTGNIGRFRFGNPDLFRIAPFGLLTGAAAGAGLFAGTGSADGSIR